ARRAGPSTESSGRSDPRSPAGLSVHHRHEANMAGITKSEEQLKPDARYGSKVLSRFINCLMQDGKKSVAQRVVYDAFDEIEKRTKGSPTAIEVFEKALENVRPE